MPKTYTIQPEYTGPRLFGAPVGDFSAFQTVLASFAIGAASFFFATFVGIIGMVVASTMQHRMLDFSIAYRWIGLPVGLLMLLLAGGYLGSILIRRVTRGS